MFTVILTDVNLAFKTCVMMKESVAKGSVKHACMYKFVTTGFRIFHSSGIRYRARKPFLGDLFVIGRAEAHLSVALFYSCR